MLDTILRRPAPVRSVSLRILACVAAVLASLPSASAQQPQRPRQKPPSPPAGGVRIADPRDERPKPPPASEPLARAFQAVQREYAARHPDVALDAHWPKAQELRLGDHGSRALLRWRAALGDVRREAARLDASAAPRIMGARLASLADWCAAEELLLETQVAPTRDPAGYVRRAVRVLAAARDAGWIEDEARAALRLRLADELPAYLADARASLLAPVPEWIDLALQDLDELAELVADTETLRTGRRPREARAAETPGAAVEAFRTWLLAQRPAAGGSAARLGAGEWARLVHLVTGADVEPRDLKARCLRELARLEGEAAAAEGDDAPEPLAEADSAELARRAWNIAARALTLGQTARVVRVRAAPRDLEVVCVESARTETESARVRALPGRPQELSILLPHRTWPVERAETRRALLEGRDLGSLGARYGLAGEALYERTQRAQRDPLRALLHRPTLRSALGLYALDWIPRVDWVENAFANDAPTLHAFGGQLRLEIARLLAALELHAEGVSVGEAALAFQRRAGVDAATALAEVRAAERDPLHGAGYVGMLEMRALEDRIARLAGDARKGLGLTLLLVTRNPDLRPADMREEADRALAAAPVDR